MISRPREKDTYNKSRITHIFDLILSSFLRTHLSFNQVKIYLLKFTWQHSRDIFVQYHSLWYDDIWKHTFSFEFRDRYPSILQQLYLQYYLKHIPWKERKKKNKQIKNASIFQRHFFQISNLFVRKTSNTTSLEFQTRFSFLYIAHIS